MHSDRLAWKQSAVVSAHACWASSLIDGNFVRWFSSNFWVVPMQHNMIWTECSGSSKRIRLTLTLRNQKIRLRASSTESQRIKCTNTAINSHWNTLCSATNLSIIFQYFWEERKESPLYSKYSRSLERWLLLPIFFSAFLSLFSSQKTMSHFFAQFFFSMVFPSAKVYPVFPVTVSDKESLEPLRIRTRKNTLKTILSRRIETIGVINCEAYV